MANKIEGGSAIGKEIESSAETTRSESELGKAALRAMEALANGSGDGTFSVIKKGMMEQFQVMTPDEVAAMMGGAKKTEAASDAHGSDKPSTEDDLRVVREAATDKYGLKYREPLPASGSEISSDTAAKRETPSENKESENKNELTEDVLADSMLDVLPLSCFKKFSGQLGLSAEQLAKGARGMSEWPLEAKQKYIELAKADNPDNNYDEERSELLNEMGFSADEINAALNEGENVDDGAEGAESKEKAERLLARLKKIGSRALEAIMNVGKSPKLKNFLKVAGFVGLAGIVTVIGANKMASRQEKNMNMPAGFVTEATDPSVVQAIEDAPVYDTESHSFVEKNNSETTTATKAEGAEDQESKYNVQGDFVKTGYVSVDPATGELRWDVTSTDYHEAKSGKYNMANAKKFVEDNAREKYGVEINADKLDLSDEKVAEAVKKSLLDLYEEGGAASLAPMIMEFQSLGLTQFDTPNGPAFAGASAEEIKQALMDRPDLAQMSMDEISKIWNQMDISLDTLDANVKYSNFYLSPNTENVKGSGDVTIVEYGATDGNGNYHEYYAAKGGAESAVYKLSYTDENGEVKALFIKRTCGQICSEHGFWAEKVPTTSETTTTVVYTTTPESTTRIETTTAVDTTTTPESTTRVETTTTTNNTTGETTTTTSETTTTGETTTTKETTTTSTTPETSTTQETTTTTNTTTGETTTTKATTTTEGTTTTRQETTTSPTTTTTRETTTTKDTTTTPETTTTHETTTTTSMTTGETTTTKATTTTEGTTTTRQETTTTPTTTTTRETTTTKNTTTTPETTTTRETTTTTNTTTGETTTTQATTTTEGTTTTRQETTTTPTTTTTHETTTTKNTTTTPETTTTRETTTTTNTTTGETTTTKATTTTEGTTTTRQETTTTTSTTGETTTTKVTTTTNETTGVTTTTTESTTTHTDGTTTTTGPETTTTQTTTTPRVTETTIQSSLGTTATTSATTETTTTTNAPKNRNFYDDWGQAEPTYTQTYVVPNTGETTYTTTAPVEPVSGDTRDANGNNTDADYRDEETRRREEEQAAAAQDLEERAINDPNNTGEVVNPVSGSGNGQPISSGTGDGGLGIDLESLFG